MNWISGLVKEIQTDALALIRGYSVFVFMKVCRQKRLEKENTLESNALQGKPLCEMKKTHSRV